jgi:DNA-binding GntR family transcriptional regulator
VLEQVDRQLPRATGHAETSALEYEFHALINKAARSRKLARFLENASRYTPARVYASAPGWRPRNAADHEAILAALRARDELAAQETILHHISDAEQRLLAHLDAIAIW